MQVVHLGVLVSVALLGGLRAQEPEVSAAETPAGEAPAASEDVQGLRPPYDAAKLAELARAAREKGLRFLVETQNPDGSWGSHDPKIAGLRDFGFQLLDRGAQDGVRTACTAICAEALLETPDRTLEQNDALERAIEDLLLPKRFAYQPRGAFNTWGYGYKLDFLARLASAPEGKRYADRMREPAVICVEGLKKYQQHQGGWGYYAGPMNDFSSMSFNTAVFASALERARVLGWHEERAMIADAIKLVQTARHPDGSFSYYGNHRLDARLALENLGSGARTVACALALHDLGVYGTADLEQSLSIFDASENYLEAGRKLIIPHTGPQRISGYFFFFGYAYVTDLALRLGAAVPDERWDRFAWTILRTQEPEGCWWDTPAGDYGDKWGTGFALQCLNRYLGRAIEK